MALPSGTQVGPYAVLSQLGAGGMGEVYRARDNRLNRDVALKVLRRLLVLGTSGQDDALDRLLREATLASALNHPNIVTIYETGVVADRPLHRDGADRRLRRCDALAAQGLPLGRTLGVARQIAEALAVAHAAQIVHRDIKPDNVMVRPDGYVKLLDFGLARVQPEAINGRPDRDPAHRAGHDPRHHRLHGAGAGARRAGRAGSGRVRARRAAVRAGDRTPPVRSAISTRHAARAALGIAGTAVVPQSGAAAGDRSADPRDAAEGCAPAPGASEVMYRLALAHDSTVAAALSSVTVSQAAGGRRGKRRRRRRVGTGRAAARVRSRAARQGAARGRLGAKPASARRRWSKRSCGSWTNAASRCASDAADARNGWPAAKPTCPCSRRSTACRGTSSSAACRVSSARWRRAGTRRSCRRRRTTRRRRGWRPRPAAGSQERLKREIAQPARRNRADVSRSSSGSTTCTGRIRRRPI